MKTLAFISNQMPGFHLLLCPSNRIAEMRTKKMHSEINNGKLTHTVSRQ